ncbi:dipeptide/oligopeptide/nickel ABC transporter ATP-binding protein [Virgibacillus indicus]|uniref:Dipeptide/oligopeptide/nickel ABC transporter ATP-binding protein n=1 Tax=Virgibacillus indicus TaxID=2024554 RepID=A0A265NBB0_9BACI|nr:ABC transporter ATP-binding protein [Virgibacillus indicus]OZU89117.1 dipeptide/oligopeptide/nickel ABC transporter ATP-binding protein [Virgibacillus indicus]
MSKENLIEVKNLNKTFTKKVGRHFFNRKNVPIHAVNNISIEIKKGETLGIIGESGCGKTTTARMLLRLQKETHGEILFNGTDLCKLNERETSKFLPNMQMIFQDPYDTLNPGMRVVDLLMEPINAHMKGISHNEKIEIIKESIEAIDLKPAERFMYRYPHELSGGQRQRIAIARAIILKPDFIAADEPTSMLDVSVRAGILNLLLKLKKQMGLTMLFITHDLTTASYMCDRIAVMYQGEVVEVGNTEKIIRNPSHPYTRALVSVVTDLNHFIENRDRIILDGEVDATIEKKGCIFVHRCPFREEHCFHDPPSLVTQQGDHQVACSCLDKIPSGLPKDQSLQQQNSHSI